MLVLENIVKENVLKHMKHWSKGQRREPGKSAAVSAPETRSTIELLPGIS